MKRVIFIIACNYRGNSAVRELNVGEDMVRVGGFFIDVAGYDDWKIVLDEPSEVVLAKLMELAATLSPGDLLVIYFAGHGLQAPDQLLVLPPGKDDPPAAKLGFLPVQDLRRRTEGRGLVRALILDCCRNRDATAAPVVDAATAFSRRVNIDSSEIPQPARDIGLGPQTPRIAARASSRFAMFCACAQDDVAPELGDTGRGLFSTALRNVLTRAREMNRCVKIDDDLRDEVESEMVLLAKQYQLGDSPRPYKEGDARPEIMPSRKQPPRRIFPALIGFRTALLVALAIAAFVTINPDAAQRMMVSLMSNLRSGKQPSIVQPVSPAPQPIPIPPDGGAEKPLIPPPIAPLSPPPMSPPSDDRQLSDLKQAIEAKVTCATEDSEHLQSLAREYTRFEKDRQTLISLVEGKTGRSKIDWGGQEYTFDEASIARKHMNFDFEQHDGDKKATLDEKLTAAKQNIDSLLQLERRLEDHAMSVQDGWGALNKINTISPSNFDNWIHEEGLFIPPPTAKYFDGP